MSSGVVASIVLVATAIGAVGGNETSLVVAATASTITQVDLTGPAGSSERFGENVTVLTNGNYVVTDPGFDSGGATDVGAVHLYNGVDDAVIATLHGTNTDDLVGNRKVTALSNGNYVVVSSNWAFGAASEAGAVTFGNGATGVSGPVSTSNSLRGLFTNDRIGSGGVTALTNGNYVVNSPESNINGIPNTGAVTLGDGTVGIMGPLSSTNSLHGSSADDQVGRGAGSGANGVTALTNGNYVVTSRLWDSGVASDVGAATFGNGSTGVSGPVTTTNSLHGSRADDQVGIGSVTALSNGNYVVASPRWDRGLVPDVGAATFGNGSTGVSGPVTIVNSLHGTNSNDGSAGSVVTALSNGNYVVVSQMWDSDDATDVGAATFGNGTTGVAGAVSPGNSLHGSTDADQVGMTGVIALSNGNYVVGSQVWDFGATANVGAATFANGTTGVTGPVTTANSLHGSTVNDYVATEGSAMTALTNGNYVVITSTWDDGATANVGAVTFANGTTGITGPVTTANSLHGTTAGDRVGNFRVTALTDGNYVVRSASWNDGATSAVGAATFGDGMTGITGPVTTSNSLHGTTTGDQIGRLGTVALPAGDYVVVSDVWDRVGTVADAGAVTFGPAAGGLSGPATPANSAIGTPPGKIRLPDDRLTSNEALPVPTSQGRVLLMQLDRSPFFTATPSNIAAATEPGASTATVGYATPSASDRRSAPTVACAPPSGSEFSIGATVVTCTATDSAGLTATTSFTVTVASTPGVITPGVITSLAPGRFADTRVAGDTIDALFEADGRRPGGSEYRVQITGRGQVPAGAKAAVMNITAINPDGTGFVTSHPCVTPRPLASSLNHADRVTLGSEIIAPLSASGEVCLYTSNATDLSVDVTGFVAADSLLEPTTPARFLDTRPIGETIDDDFEGGVRPSPGSTVRLTVAGRGQIPADAAAIVVNVTAIGADGVGFLTVHSCLATPPNAASLNYVPGVNRGNELVATLDSAGDVCLFSSTGTHMSADVVGYLPAGSDLRAVDPARLLDTRPAGMTVDDVSSGEGKRSPGAKYELQVAGRAGIPTSATAAVINITAIQPDGTGFVTVDPCNDPRPLASSLNHVDRVNGGNEIVARLSATGTICLYTSNSTHLTADLVGYSGG